jgi:hypothetical protein
MADFDIPFLLSQHGSRQCGSCRGQGCHFDQAATIHRLFQKILPDPASDWCNRQPLHPNATR